ncbi:hypothetical protein EGR_00043 [Echinococcus granulosus]|uniref:Uncharacterized protein n=1 Tax=Echinococcus granulosus TaxID=6210 RepID=W6VCX3_ECHGR|nr:hypothetical protein EGR_00043 [Echinococcus granulosus]EUB64774.1 hypothetical protein EGR_00043 [Echinococcus granulosus]
MLVYLPEIYSLGRERRNRGRCTLIKGQRKEEGNTASPTLAPRLGKKLFAAETGDVVLRTIIWSKLVEHQYRPQPDSDAQEVLHILLYAHSKRDDFIQQGDQTDIYANGPLPSGYRSDDCGPRLTDAFVKSWSTSNFEYVESLSDLGPESSAPSEPNLANNDFVPVEDALYVCYNVFHGFCERLQLTNISVIKPWKRHSSLLDFHPKRAPDIPIPVVNWNTSLSSTLTVDSSYIYVGLEQDQFQDATLVDLDPISIRLRDFDYASKEPSVKSSLRLQESDFRIKYKFSFQYTLEKGQRGSSQPVVPHIYFVAQQPSITEFGMLETRIARVCSGDKFLHSYADLELSCEGCFLPDGGQAQKMALIKDTDWTLGIEEKFYSLGL